MPSFKKNTFMSLAILIPLISTGFITSCAMKQQQETVGQYVDGGVVTSQVKTKILADKKLRNTSITVKTYKDQVQLSGYVHSEAQKMHAEAVARSVEGVTSVDNAILVK